MSTSVHGVVEIFVKSNDGKYKVGATYEDDDENVVYINKIFPEAMMDFVNASGDPINVAKYDLNTIKNRICQFKSTFINLNGSVEARLNSIIDFYHKQSRYL